jgi:transcription elongation factor Elf1
VLDELIQDGAVVYANESILISGSTTNRSMYRLEPNMEVVTKHNNKIKIKDVQYSTSIHCPFHNDESPSAYISKNKRNQKFIHCKTCNMTWWMRQKDEAKDYDFYSFDDSIDKIMQCNNITQKIYSPFGDFLKPIKISPKNIYVSNNKFLSLSKLQDGMRFIKSQKGSGKTTYLAEILNDIIYPFQRLVDYENDTDFETESSFIGKEKILLVGHRQALIGDLCKRLKLNCYLDDEKFKKNEIVERQKRYGVCLDSLWKVRKAKYDIIIIDEVEQVLAHFLSETIGEKRIGIFNLLSNLIQSARKVVALDADLGWVSFVTLTSLTNPQLSQNSKFGGNLVNKEYPVHIYINKNTTQNDNLYVYASQNHLIQEVMIKSWIISVFFYIKFKSKIKTLHEAFNKFLADNV